MRSLFERLFKKRQRGKWCCPYCGSDEVQCQYWIDPNTQTILDHTENYSWCSACSEDGLEGETKRLEYVYPDGTCDEYVGDGKYNRIPFVPEKVREEDEEDAITALLF